MPCEIQIDPVMEDRMKAIVELAIKSFPEMNTYMNKKPEIDKRIEHLIAEHCPDGVPTSHIYSPGMSDAVGFHPFRDLSHMLTAALDHYYNGRQPSDPPPVNILWASWMGVAEALFLELTAFAKKLDGFRDLSVDDQIVLLKAARIEVCTFMA